jgi:hypothetical protein
LGDVTEIISPLQLKEVTVSIVSSLMDLFKFCDSIKIVIVLVVFAINVVLAFGWTITSCCVTIAFFSLYPPFFG